MRTIILLLFFAGLSVNALTVGDLPMRVSDLEPGQQAALSRALQKTWQPGLAILPEHQKYMDALLGRLLFNGEPAEKCALQLKKFHGLLEKGAPGDELLELSEMAFNHEVNDDLMVQGAKGLKYAKEENLPPDIYYELISHGILEKWQGDMVLEGVKALKKARDSKLDMAKAAIAVIIRFDRGLEGVAADKAVQQELSDLRAMKAYGALDEVVKGGVPADIAKEIYLTGVQGSWKTQDIETVLRGLKKALDKGLTVQKMALAMVVRMEQGLEGVSAEQMVTQELNYVASLKDEQSRVESVSRSPDVQQRLALPVKPKDNAQRTGISRLNEELLRNSIISFYNAPTTYLSGGTQRGGADCSGFVQSCYKEQGIILPRVSQEQYTSLKLTGRIVSEPDLKLGDLVFFNANGWGSITHVGMYYGNGKFVHSCSSQGVTFTPFDKPYFKKRFVEAGRAAD